MEPELQWQEKLGGSISHLGETFKKSKLKLDDMTDTSVSRSQDEQILF